ncbi:hypothetical protein PPL_01449 [Heterostelium album PN500]|uniref:Uncharacterized protein n=1 Tax=Heterostelium pallidum (strain ATCC 26659 / Pp 5 / PN500) TaxID=670386 RepID=D3AZA9_HETP5|nr:hypothetical protein PPL_01449 [Heterostelium album PN500]EFA85492.1 hypothetical protein PPL_01449 [Heterostelium album PN500]|eukprot:XP_020437600.1 hypothetical protein PPL_01449 [Heterostelium album PN500]
MDSQHQINKMIVNTTGLPLHHNNHYYHGSRYATSISTPTTPTATTTKSNIDCNNSVNNFQLIPTASTNQYNCITSNNININININSLNSNYHHQVQPTSSSSSSASSFSYNKKRSRDIVDIEQLGILNNNNNNSINKNIIINNNNNSLNNNSHINNNSFTSSSSNSSASQSKKENTTFYQNHLNSKGATTNYSTSPLSNSFSTFTSHFYNDDDYNDEDDHNNVKIFKSRKDDNDKNIVPTSPHLHKSINSPFASNLSTSPLSSVPVSPLLLPPSATSTPITPRQAISSSHCSTPRSHLPNSIQQHLHQQYHNQITPQLSPLTPPSKPDFKLYQQQQQQQQQQEEESNRKQQQINNNDLSRFELTFEQLKIFEEDEPELIELNSSWNEEEHDHDELALPPRSILSCATRQPYQLSPIESVVVRSRNPMAPYLLYGTESRFSNSYTSSSNNSYEDYSEESENGDDDDDEDNDISSDCDNQTGGPLRFFDKCSTQH